MIVSITDARHLKLCPSLGTTCHVADCMMWRWVEEGKMGFCGMAGGPLEIKSAIIDKALTKIEEGLK